MKKKKIKTKKILEELSEDKEIKELVKFFGIVAGMAGTIKLLKSINK